MYISQDNIKIDNSLGNTLKIYFNQYLKHLNGKHTSFLILSDQIKHMCPHLKIEVFAREATLWNPDRA